MASKNNRFHRLILIAQFYFPLWTRNSGTIRYFGQNWFYLLVTGFYWTSPNKRNAELKLYHQIKRNLINVSFWDSYFKTRSLLNLKFFVLKNHLHLYAMQQYSTVGQRYSLKGWWRDKCPSFGSSHKDEDAQPRYISEINNIMSGQSHNS